MSEAIDPINVIYKLQRLLEEDINNNGQVLMGGSVDSMEKYNYILGNIHTLEQNNKELHNILNLKET